MKKATHLLTMALLALLFVVSSNAFAAMDVQGDKLLFGYYDVRMADQGGPGLSDNYFTVVNTSNTYVQAHVRIRTGKSSIELMDFDIVLSPHDVFQFDLFQDPTSGETVFASCDGNNTTVATAKETLDHSGFTLNFDRDGNGVNECYLMGNTLPSGNRQTDLITTCDTTQTVTTAIAETRKGYVEVILEGAFVLSPTCTATMVESGLYELYDWADGAAAVDTTTDAANDVDLDGATASGDVFTAAAGDLANNCMVTWPPDPNILFGRVYYVDYDPATVSANRMSSQNARALQWTRWSGFTNTSGAPIVHAINYTGELARAAYAEANNERMAGWAYSAATVAANPDGANDMNYCLWTGTLTVGGTATRVTNKVGAGATYGPMLIDFAQMSATPIVAGTYTDGVADYYRNGQWGAAVFLVDLLNSQNNVRSVSSHYWNYAGTPFPTTTFATTFPLMHYIAQSATTQITGMYDMMENACVSAVGKFVSPGLPTSATLSPEVTISDPLNACSSTHFEGYVVWGYNVTSDGPARYRCEDGVLASGWYAANTCDANNDNATNIADQRASTATRVVTGYAPMVEAFSINSSDTVYSTTPMTVLTWEPLFGAASAALPQVGGLW